MKRVKRVASFLLDHRRQLATVLGNVEWLELSRGRIVVDETVLNNRLLPLLKEHLPSEVKNLDVLIRPGYLEINAVVYTHEEKVTGVYRIRVKELLFGPSGHRLVLLYEEEYPLDGLRLGKRLLLGTGRFLLQAITGKTLISHILKDTPGVRFDQNKMEINLDEIPQFQQWKQHRFLGVSLLERLKIKEIIFEEQRIIIPISILGWDEPMPKSKHGQGVSHLEENNSGQQKANSVVIIERDHRKYYDKLRKKIENFISDKGGETGRKNAKYLLLAPDLFVLFARLLRDERVPMKSKVLIGVVVAYFISPIDIIPEAITGPLGFLDDVVLAVLALKSLLLDVDQWIVEEHWNGEESLLEIIQDVVKKADNLIGTKAVKMIRKVLTRK